MLLDQWKLLGAFSIQESAVKIVRPRCGHLTIVNEKRRNIIAAYAYFMILYVRLSESNGFDLFIACELKVC